MNSTTFRMIVAATAAAALAACGATAQSRPTATELLGPPPPSSVKIGEFPPYPRQALPESVAASLQKVIDKAVADREVQGIAAAVAVAHAGRWVGAAGIDPQGTALTTATSVETASIAKTITAAQTLRLVEEGELRLDDQARSHLPPALARYDLNHATVRDLLGMRSGLSDPLGPLADGGATAAEQLKALPSPRHRAGTTIEYANINYLLLGEIVEHITGQQFWSVVHADVLHHPGLDNLTSSYTDARAADGLGVQTDPATLARWGYLLYGGFVLSHASLRKMVDFRGEWYGLGTVDFSHPRSQGPHDSPGVGHGGWGAFVTRLIAFPRTGVVVSVQANASALNQITPVMAALRDAATR